MDRPKRKKNRLIGYDYSRNGAYFVTICTRNRQEILGTVGAGIARPHLVELSSIGLTIDAAINKIGEIYQCVNVDRYVIMPNHVHMLLVIEGDGRAMRAPTVSTIVNQMKGYVTKQVGHLIWQKLFHDHIIRNEQEYIKVAEYIENNPLLWEKDCYHDETEDTENAD